MCISQLSCWELQCGPFCCFYPVRCLLRRSEEEASPPPLPPPPPLGLWRRGRGLSIKRNGCLSCDGKRTGLWREEMRGGLPCLAHKEMACHPLEIKNDLAKKNKRFFSKKKNSRNSGVSSMQICLISYARPMRFPCTSRVSLPTFLPFPFEIFKKVSHAFFSGVDVESVRCCGGRSLSGPLFSAPF